MAAWDSADLLARAKRMAARPSTDEDKGPTDTTVDDLWYALLTERHAYWVGLIAAHVPWAMMGAPILMSTADGGLTYTFAGGIRPLSVQIFDAPNGRLMRPAAYWDETGDYIWEGDKIRFPRNATKQFAGGPVARYVLPPGTVSAASEPTLQPADARVLVVYGAVALWASRGGLRDARPYEKLEKETWAGDPRVPGDGGILARLKTTNPFGGMAAITGPYVEGFAYLNLVHGYTPR